MTAYATSSTGENIHRSTMKSSSVASAALKSTKTETVLRCIKPKLASGLRVISTFSPAAADGRGGDNTIDPVSRIAPSLPPSERSLALAPPSASTGAKTQPTSNKDKRLAPNTDVSPNREVLFQEVVMPRGCGKQCAILEVW